MNDDLYDDEGPPPQLVEMPSTISPLRKVPVTVSRINLSIHSVLVCNLCTISRGGGPRGARGARAPLRIGDLRTKIFEN